MWTTIWLLGVLVLHPSSLSATETTSVAVQLEIEVSGEPAVEEFGIRLEG